MPIYRVVVHPHLIMSSEGVDTFDEESDGDIECPYCGMSQIEPAANAVETLLGILTYNIYDPMEKRRIQRQSHIYHYLKGEDKHKLIIN